MKHGCHERRTTSIHAACIDLIKNPLGDYRDGSVVERRNGLTQAQFEAWRDNPGPNRRVICVGWVNPTSKRYEFVPTPPCHEV